jgi:hypothetical protein
MIRVWQSTPFGILDFTRLAQAADFTAIDKAAVRSIITHVEFTTPWYQDDP